MSLNILFLLFASLFSCNCSAQKVILDKKFKNLPESKEMAVIIINEGSVSYNQTLTQKISDLFMRDKGYNTNPSFFNTEFLKRNDFEKLFKADRYRIKKLHLKNNLDYMCLGKFNTTSTSLNEYKMYTVNVSLKLNIVNVISGAVFDSRIYSDRGIGLTKGEAIQNGIDSIIKQLK